MISKIRLGRPADAAALKSVDSMVPRDPARADAIDKWLREDTVMVAELDGKVVGYGVSNHGFLHQSQVEVPMVHPGYRGRPSENNC